jgi:hypothetical protein
MNKLSRERLKLAILKDIAAGMLDKDIMNEYKLSYSTYYRLKRKLSKECKSFTDISKEDIALQEQICYERLTEDRKNAAEHALKSNNPRWQWIASELAITIFNMRAAGITEAVKNRRLAEHMTDKTGIFHLPDIIHK